ncbi:small G protein signaling modulator 1 isoform X2 [Amborella trichopoda]|uniref:small G protein signaling modulator 1 isoform X2 n=1 Tax=Amborella trichopoda TaxID=13333 RepID=UPI0009BFABA6|nr:small G protein signaling modulator 1 isoform X2 [Amborella trichopoda]|eukprot:XP_020531937.1 small G protein signaling modulator 1 isoform X2 [Amborella trichopoda]
MSFDGEESPWICLQHSPAKGGKMLKPEKWQAAFDNDGKLLGFQKALKLIVLGGVNPSIRAEVWEFLLGCYALGSTAEYRQHLRTVRRKRYEDLIKQCQMMHSSIGTGSLAFVVGSKVMDVRTLSKDNSNGEVNVGIEEVSEGALGTERFCEMSSDLIGVSSNCERKSSSNTSDLLSVRQSMDIAECNSSLFVSSSSPCQCFSSELGREACGSQYLTENYCDFPPLPVTNLFEKSDDAVVVDKETIPSQRISGVEDEAMRCFQINNNVELILETKTLPHIDTSHASAHEIEDSNTSFQGRVSGSNELESRTGKVGRLRISDPSQAMMVDTSASYAVPSNEDRSDRTADWLWTLHKIVVDVVRTDSHLDFYEDSRNVARMSDILAVYAWVDPATGYCQGMSDLLSPFVVLYEDNADAFWCFEMLLRRMRQNFQMEGPTRVMNQLQALKRILELTDVEIFTHLSMISADSLLFAFRMLLVLFRRELSFDEALCMWEMMWAADYDEVVVRELENNCLEPLFVHIPEVSQPENRGENDRDGVQQSNEAHTEHLDIVKPETHHNGLRSLSRRPFCGLTARNLWTRHDHVQRCSISSAAAKNGDNELSVFCVAAILIINRPKILKGTQSMDDLIKMFNDNKLEISVKRCIKKAIKIRKKYFHKGVCSYNIPCQKSILHFQTNVRREKALISMNMALLIATNNQSFRG